MSVDTGQSPVVSGAGPKPGFLRTHWRGLLISFLVLSFLPIPIWLLVNNYLDSGGVEALAYGESLGAPRYNYFGNPVEVYSPGEIGKTADLCVTFEFLGLDETNSQASFGILIDATPSGEQLLNHLKSLKHPAATGTMLISSTSGLTSQPVSFPVSSLEKFPVAVLEKAQITCNSSGNVEISKLDSYAGFRTTQSIFTLGTPRAFPDDWYELDDAVTISIQGVKLDSSLIMTSRDEDYTLSASVYRPGEKNNAGPNILEFTIRRPWLFVVYTYVVAVMPFFLLIAIFLLKYCRKRTDPTANHPDGEMPKHSEVAFGIVATLVAILPLRSVLVPSSLPSPTRLDIYFGLGTVFLVASSIIWVVATSPRPPTVNQAQTAESATDSHPGRAVPAPSSDGSSPRELVKPEG